MPTDPSIAHSRGVEAPTEQAFELVVFLAADTVEVRALPKVGRVSIGRTGDNDVAIRHPSVSRNHAALHLDGARMWIEDLGSTNGSSARSVRAPSTGTHTFDLRRSAKKTFDVALGDCITFGSITAVIRRATPAADRASDDAPAGEIVVRAPAMHAVYKQARLAAQGTISVLILGETGVGKEVLARAVHDRSPRAKRPFLALNCAALSESLLESELFGHEKGAFTGAATARPGLFESAEGGTIFLDEVGELPMSIQVKLLRTLEERKVLRVGGRAPLAIDVRFLAATNRDLEAEVEKGTFRGDLFFRLNGIALTIPPLRERVEEIAPLAHAFAANAARTIDRPSPPGISDAALAALERHRWPGNIRELRNVIERAVVLCEGPAIWPEHLPEKLVAGASASLETTDPGRREPVDAPSTHTFDRRSKRGAGPDEVERDRILAALEACAGNQTKAAERLGMSRRTLVSRLDEYGLSRPRKNG